MSLNLYVLDNRKPVRVEDWLAWAEWHFAPSDQRRIVARSTVGPVEVSTVFLGIGSDDHGAPLLFESMAFGFPGGDLQNRCATWEDAEAMHAAMVALVRARLTNPNPK